MKKKTLQRCFPANFAKFLRTPFLTEHLRWQLLHLKYLSKKSAEFYGTFWLLMFMTMDLLQVGQNVQEETR